MNGPRKVSAFRQEAIDKRLQKLLDFKNEYLRRIEEEGYDVVLAEVTLQAGNEKTGKNCYTTSLSPILDCVNCSECHRYCYDIRNDCRFDDVMRIRARNSALREVNPVRFWARIGELVAENYVEQLRINVGSDLRDKDFRYVNMLVANPNPRCDILFFTKNYKGLNEFLSNDKFFDNVHAIVSRWQGMECNNMFNLPESHVLWKDGSTTAPEFGAYYCRGNCTACHFKGEGCWVLNKGEHVIFLAH